MSWETTSGRPTDYTGTVEEMTFTLDSRVKSGEELFALFKIRPDEGEDVEVDEDGLIEERFTMGQGWRTLDGGETITGKKKFNKNSMMGRLVDHCVTQLGSFDAAEKFFDGSPTEARVWVDMHATWNEVDFPYDDRNQTDEDGKPVKKHFLMNLPFDISKPGSKKGSGTAAKSAAKATGAAKKAASGNGTVDIEAKLGKLAAALDFEDFVEQAMKVPGVEDSDEWVAKLADTDYYESIKG